MSSRLIKDLHPTLQPIATKFLKRADVLLGDHQAFITDGFRSNKEQTKLYAQGRTKPSKIVTHARAGQSPHNYGLAFDIAFRKDGTKEAKWTLSKYKKLAKLAKDLGLTWGGTWTKFRDNPHYELKNWKQLKEGNMADTNYKGLDLTNKDSMKVAVDVWDEVVKQKLYVKKSYHDRKLREKLKALGETHKNSMAQHLRQKKTLQEIKEEVEKIIEVVIKTPEEVALALNTFITKKVSWGKKTQSGGEDINPHRHATRESIKETTRYIVSDIPMQCGSTRLVVITYGLFKSS